MDLREIEPGYTVAPQILPADMQALADHGYTMVICNRPDAEVTPDLAMARMRDAAETAGLAFVENPVVGGGLTLNAIDRQREALSESPGPVLAYCASGTRSAVLWAFSAAGERDVDDILAATAAAGYPLDGLAPQLLAMSSR